MKALRISTERAPRDLALERDVLGQILIFDGVAGRYRAAGLDVGDLSHPAHQVVWLQVVEHLNAGVPVDYPTIAAGLRAGGRMKEVGEGYLVSLDSAGSARPSDLSLSYVVRRLRELHLQREIFYGAGNLLREFEDDQAGVSVDTLRERLRTLTEGLTCSGLQTWVVSQELIAQVEEAFAHEHERRAYFGLADIDEIVGGIRPGEVCELMGRTGVGKTVVLVNCLSYMTEQPNAGVILFSLEMPAPQIGERMLRVRASLTREDLRDGLVAKTFDRERYAAEFERTLIIDTSGLSLGQMEALIDQARHGPLASTESLFVVIDHLGLVGGDNQLGTYDRISKQARELKTLAKRHHCAVLIAVQPSRRASIDGSDTLDLGSARDSGVIEEVADYLVAVRRIDGSSRYKRVDRERFQDVLFVSVLKNRHGRRGKEYSYKMADDSLRLTPFYMDAPEPLRIAKDTK